MTKELIFRFGMPELKPEYIRQEHFMHLKPIAYKSTKKPEFPGILHFFIDDHRFNSIYKNIEILTSYAYKQPQIQYICSPDWSIYMDMARPLQIYNCYKKAYVSFLLQSRNYKIIPTLSWSDPQSYPYAFEGLPNNSCYCLSFRSADRDSKEFWRGLMFFIKKFSPMLLIIFCAERNRDYFHRRIQTIFIDLNLKSNYIFLDL